MGLFRKKTPAVTRHEPEHERLLRERERRVLEREKRLASQRESRTVTVVDQLQELRERNQFLEQITMSVVRGS